MTKRNLIVTLANQAYVDQVKQLFSSIYHNAGWKGDYMLLAYEVNDEDCKWFTKRGIIVKKIKPYYSQAIGGAGLCTVSKLSFFTDESFKAWDYVLYMDGDIIVRGPLDSLCTVKKLGAHRVHNIMRSNLVGQFYKYSPKQLAELSSFLDLTGPALNSGVMVINTSIIKKEREKEFKEIMDKYKDIILVSDETVLNIYFHKQWEEFSAIFNFCPNFEIWHRECKPEELKAVVMHSYSHISPFRKIWDPNSPFLEEYKLNLKKADSINLKKILPPRITLSKTQIDKDGMLLLNLTLLYPGAMKKADLFSRSIWKKHHRRVFFEKCYARFFQIKSYPKQVYDRIIPQKVKELISRIRCK